MLPLVSVVVPCFNQAHYLAQTLSSVQEQSYSSWECIIVNDGSTDHTEQIAQQFCSSDTRFKYIKQINRGLSSARNAGIRAACGKYLQFLDSDDLLQSDKFRKQVEFLEYHLNVDLVYGLSEFFFNDDVTVSYLRRDKSNYTTTWMPLARGKGECILEELLNWNIMVVSSPLLRLDKAQGVGDFDESLKSLEDWEYWIRCALSGLHFEFLPAENTSTLIRVGKESMMSNTSTMLEYEVLIRKRLIQSIGGNPTLYNYQLNHLRVARRKYLITTLQEFKHSKIPKVNVSFFLREIVGSSIGSIFK